MTSSGTKLDRLVQVRRAGVRSVHIERDLIVSAVAQGYVLTSQGRATLGRILDRFRGETPSRAWTLTGPYGSGKSYFSLFLMNLLSRSLPMHDYAVTQLAQVEPLFVNQIHDLTGPTASRGWLAVPITGYRTSLQNCIRRGLYQALQPYTYNPEVAQLAQDRVLLDESATSRALIEWLQRLQEIIRKPGLDFNGILIVLDEMGKPLEYTAAQTETADIYLLQELAEFANRAHDQPLAFIGILHQTFERYAGFLDSATQREWSKIQGRFEDVGFQEPPHQQMWLLAKAIEVAEPSIAIDLMGAYIDAAQKSGWRPPLMQANEFVQVCRRAYPLHPTTLVALPYLFRRLAQNERSLFAYLASFEPFGFQEFLRRESAPAVVRLAHLFDYLTANFQGRLYSVTRARIIVETLERLENAPKLGPLATDVLKTIGLLNWLAEVSPIQATRPSLLAALRGPDRTDAQINETLERLQKQSLIVFRRFNDTYAIWQGGDVDLEERLLEAHRHLTEAYSVAEAVQTYLPPRPIVAQRHSYQSGMLRYFDVHYSDPAGLYSINSMPASGADGVVILCLPLNAAEFHQCEEWAQAKPIVSRRDVVVAIARRTARFAELMHELRCLHWVRQETPELRDDPVARRELRARIDSVESLVRNELARTLSSERLAEADGCRWFVQGKDETERARRGLSHLLSWVCDNLYAQSPCLWNELLNRRVLSSQGAAARRNLIEAMWTQGHLPNLGIQGYPPERSMYASFLAAGGLHRVNHSGEGLFGPPPGQDPLHLWPVWRALEDAIFAGPPEPRAVSELFKTLKAPPYGISDGVLPVLLCAFLQANATETTLYAEGTLLPEPRVADWEVLLRRPELFAVAGCRVTGPRAAVIERLARGLQVDAAALPVVRELIRRLKTLPHHVWRTSQRSEQTPARRCRWHGNKVRSGRIPIATYHADYPT